MTDRQFINDFFSCEYSFMGPFYGELTTFCIFQ